MQSCTLALPISKCLFLSVQLIAEGILFINQWYDNPLQCSCLENPMDRGAWWAAVYGVAQSRTRLKRLSSSSSSRDILHKTLPTGIAYIRTSIMTTIKILFTERSWSSLLINNYCQSIKFMVMCGVCVCMGYTISYSRGSSTPRDKSCVSCISCIGRQILYHQHHLGSPQNFQLSNIIKYRRAPKDSEQGRNLPRRREGCVLLTAVPSEITLESSQIILSVSMWRNFVLFACQYKS